MKRKQCPLYGGRYCSDRIPRIWCDGRWLSIDQASQCSADRFPRLTEALAGVDPGLLDTVPL